MTSRPGNIPFLFGIRGISALYVMCFHLNYMVLDANAGRVPRIYHQLTDWIRYGDFRVAAFFVISGYLLMLPTTRTADWILPRGVKGFLQRRAQRLLIPYYVAFALSIVLFVVWAVAVGQPFGFKMLAVATLTHLLLIHNLHPHTMLLVNDTLWNVALEFQCYVLFAFVLLPSVRRWGPWPQLAVVTLFALAPHFLLHGFLDWVRPWFVVLYSMGVAVCALANRAYPRLGSFERRAPWGVIWLVAALVLPFAVWASGIDTPYGDGWLANLVLGVAVSAFLVYARLGTPGLLGPAARATIRFLQFAPLRRLGRFSYSIYLIHFPILRLLIGVTGRLTSSFWLEAALAFLVYAPVAIGLAYLFHLRFERPFQEQRASLPAPAPNGARPATANEPMWATTGRT
jgi:peptidoglycan/LPS O-acetylase OafA/YrhL